MVSAAAATAEAKTPDDFLDMKIAKTCLGPTGSEALAMSSEICVLILCEVREENQSLTQVRQVLVSLIYTMCFNNHSGGSDTAKALEGLDSPKLFALIIITTITRVNIITRNHYLGKLMCKTSVKGALEKRELE